MINSVLIYLVSPMILMSIVLYIALYTDRHNSNKKHLKEYEDVAPESSIYHPKQKKNKRVV